MTTIRILLVISCLATVAPAAVKRDEFGGANPSGKLITIIIIVTYFHREIIDNN